MYLNWHITEKYFTFLKNAKWIAHTIEITNEEALYGGDYNFKRLFNFPITKDKIISAEILFVVDDYCTIIFNNTRICENIFVFNELHKYDIKGNLLYGDNEIRFQIKNADFILGLYKTSPEDPAVLAKEKNKFNPYGFKYRINLRYKK